jgi:hypothetical protein
MIKRLRQRRPLARAVSIAVLLIAGAALLCRRNVVRAAERPALRVLLVGNSYTYYNGLGDLLATIARSSGSGPEVVPTLEAPGGTTLRQHIESGAAANLIATGRFDVVVLQEQSALGGGVVDGRTVFGERRRFHAAVRELVQLARAAGARPVLFATWARRQASAADEDADLAQLSDAYEEIGTALDVTVAPVGRAWRLARRELPALALHAGDGSHPTPAGSYLTACVLYATITGRSPVGAATGMPGASLSREAASALQRVALRAALSPGK